MNQSKYTTLLLALAFLMGSCKKYLDVQPKGKAIVQTIDQYNGLFNSNFLIGYSDFKTQNGVTAIIGTADLAVVMSDDVFSSLTYLSALPANYTNAFKWLPDVYLPDDDAHEWGAFYSANYVYNVVANGVMDAQDGTPDQKKQLLAEARANRALMHLMVAGYFAKPYNAATAATDPGIPLVTKADAGETSFQRATVQQVYDFIISELKAAIPDLPAQTTSRLRLAQTGAYYILGQAYFWMGDYTNALTALNNAKAGLSNTSVALSLYDYNSTMSTWYSAATPWRGASSYPFLYNSTETIYLKQISNSTFYTRNCLYIKPTVLNLFASDDQRLKFFYNKNQQNGTITLPGTQRNSPGSANWGASIPNLYLMLAECEARTNDLLSAKADIETLRSKRMPAASATVTITTKDAMVKTILAERQREFAGTGMRWFDMRRLSGDAAYNNIDGTHSLDGTGYTLTPDRLVLRIPPKILAYTPSMPNNP